MFSNWFHCMNWVTDFRRAFSLHTLTNAAASQGNHLARGRRKFSMNIFEDRLSGKPWSSCQEGNSRSWT